MKYFLPAIIVCLALAKCTKGPDDLSGPATLKGVGFIYDTLSGLTTGTPVKNVKVFLRYDNTPNSFLYSTTTNTAGQYQFGGISPDKSYVIYASTDSGGVKYEGQKSYAANSFANGQSDTLKLFPSAGTQNGVHLIVQDSVGGRLANITAWVFNSPVLFAADTSAGKVFDMVTNPYGVTNKYNLFPARYYFRVKTKIGNIDLAAEESIDVTSTGIKTLVLTLRTRPLTRNGIEMMVLDRFGTPASGAVSYFYRSFSVFQADTVTYSQNIFKLTSNANGFASTYVIDTGRYYFRTIRVINTDTLKKTDFVDVGINLINRNTVKLQ